MIETFFLPQKRWDEYGSWLISQDSETLRNYFGISVTAASIDSLMQRIHAEPSKHHLLVAIKNGKWAGIIHMASEGSSIEFGVIVAREFRRCGIAGVMMDEALVWARNRQYSDLFMHCIAWNHPIRRLCEKFGLHPKNVWGDSEVQMKLDPPDGVSLFKEWQVWQKNIYFFDFWHFFYNLC